jgi:hypothetical protein
VLAVGVVTAVAQFLAFADDLRRYTVGGTRDLLYFLHPQWQPPLPPFLLTLGYAVLVVAFVGWLLGWRRTNGAAPAVADPSSSTATPTAHDARL